MSLLHCYTNREYDLSLQAFGEGVAEDANFRSSLDEILAEFRAQQGRDPIDVSYEIEDTAAYGLDYWFTAVAPGYLDRLDTLKELILPSTVESVGLTTALEKLMKGNRTLIRGPFDSYAERLAAELDLPFRPADLEIARYIPEVYPETTVLTLVFRRDGTACVREDVSSPGSSASHSFGGTFWHELPRAFYRTGTAEQIAGKLPLTDEILENGALADFIARAREKDKSLYWGKNRW